MFSGNIKKVSGMKWVKVHDFTQEKTCTPLKIKLIENSPTVYLQVLLILSCTMKFENSLRSW